MKFFSVLCFSFLFFSSPLLSQKRISQDNLLLGTGTSVDKIIEGDIGLGAANPKIRFNPSTPSIDFAFDGVNYSPLGSGSGGGGSEVNLAQENGDFESSPATKNWTNTGAGTFASTAVFSEVAFGDGAGKWDAAAAADVLDFDSITIPSGMQNRQCHFEFYYKGGDANITASVHDGTSDVESLVLKANTNFKTSGRVLFACPTAGTTLSFRLTASADAAVIYIDNIFFGTGASQVGSFIGKWTDFTVNYTSGGDLATETISRWRRVGESMEVEVLIDYSGTSTDTVIAFDIPDGKNIDISKIRATAGSASIKDQTNTGKQFFIGHDVRNTNKIQIYGLGDSLDSATPELNDSISVNISFVVDGWGTYVNLVNDSTVYQEIRFSTTGMTADKTITASPTSIDLWKTSTAILEGGGSFDGEFYTIPTDGWYEIKASGSWNKSSLTATAAKFFIYKNDSINIKNTTYSYTSAFFTSIATEYVGKLVKGDTISVRSSQNSGADEDLYLGDSDAQFTIMRIADVTAGDTSGFLYATADNGGLISAEESGTFTPKIVGTTGGTDPTQNVQSGTYYRLGKLVFINLRVSISSVNSPTGNIIITGLPFVPVFINRLVVSVGSLTNVTGYDLGTVLGSFLGNLGGGGMLYLANNTGSGISVSALSATSSIDVTATYTTN